MPYRMGFDKVVNYAGGSFPNRVAVSAEGEVSRNVNVPAGKTGGQLTTRTDADTGVVTMPAGHGFITADVVDIFWVDAGVSGSRRGMTATVAANAVTVDGGAGDNLPPLNNATIVMTKTTVRDFVLTGNNVKGYLASSTAPGWITFLSAADALLKTVRITTNNGTDSWNNVDLTLPANPFAGLAVAKVAFSHGQASVQRMVAACLIS